MLSYLLNILAYNALLVVRTGFLLTEILCAVLQTYIAHVYVISNEAGHKIC